MTITLELPPDVEATLKQEAALSGQSLEDCILRSLREVSLTQKQEFETAVSGICRGMADATAGRELSLKGYFSEIVMEQPQEDLRPNVPLCILCFVVTPLVIIFTRFMFAVPVFFGSLVVALSVKEVGTKWIAWSIFMGALFSVLIYSGSFLSWVVAYYKQYLVYCPHAF